MHDASSLSDTIRKCGEDIHQRIDPLHQSFIAIPKLLKCRGLALEYGLDGIDRVALLELSGEQMFEKRFPSLLLVLT